MIRLPFAMPRWGWSVLGILAVVIATALLVRSCDSRRDKAAQSRVDASQGQAQAESGKDAIDTVSRAGEAQAASEGQSRRAEQDIRSASGAGDAVNPAARDAGLAALCKRAIYRNHPRCRKDGQ